MSRVGGQAMGGRVVVELDETGGGQSPDWKRVTG